MKTLLITIANTPDERSGFPATLTDIIDNRSVDFTLKRVDVDKVVDSVTKILASENRDPAALPNVGRKLYELMTVALDDPQWLGSQENPGQAEPVLTYLDIEPAELQLMPWELMAYNEKPNQNLRVVRGNPMMSASADQNEPLSLPIRILVIVCAELAASDSVVYGVYRGLGGQPGIWQVDVLRTPTREDVSKRMISFAPHILHIVSGEAQGPDSRDFQVHRREDEEWRLGLDDILNRKESARPRLLILNVCHASQMILPSLHQWQGGALIAMRPEINAHDSGKVIEKLYEHFTQTACLEEAVWKTRNWLWDLDYSSGEWGRIVLAIYGNSAAAIRKDLPDLDKRLRSLLRQRHYRNGRELVDRVDEHLRIWGKQPDHPDAKVVTVTGAAHTGKTELIHSCMLTWELRGVPTVFVDLKEGHTQSKLSASDALLMFCQKLRNQLNELMVPGSQRPADDEVTENIHQLNKIIDGLKNDSEPASVLPFDKTCDILAAMAVDSSLLVFVDHIEQLMDDASPQFFDELLLPISESANKLDNVYAIVAGQNEAFYSTERRWQSIASYLEDVGTRVDLQMFRDRCARILDAEFGARKGWEEKEWTMIAAPLSLRKGDWSPDIFTLFTEIYRQVVMT
jgi:hypothetical protein